MYIVDKNTALSLFPHHIIPFKDKIELCKFFTKKVESNYTWKVEYGYQEKNLNLRNKSCSRGIQFKNVRIQ